MSHVTLTFTKIHEETGSTRAVHGVFTYRNNVDNTCICAPFRMEEIERTRHRVTCAVKIQNIPYEAEINDTVTLSAKGVRCASSAHANRSAGAALMHVVSIGLSFYWNQYHAEELAVGFHVREFENRVLWLLQKLHEEINCDR